MPTLSDSVAAFVAAREFDAATLSRLAFRDTQFGDCDVTEISPYEVEAALWCASLVGSQRQNRPRRAPSCTRSCRPPRGRSL